MTNTYVAVDLETTGLNPKHDKIIEIGAVKVVDGIIQEEFSTFVNPRRMLEPRIIELTGIMDEDLIHAPDLEEVMVSFLEFCKDLPILGHQVMFEFSFLKRAAVNQNFQFEKDGIDTLKLCRILMPEEEKKTLEAACAYFRIERTQVHRALGDAKDAHFLYQALKERYGMVEFGKFLEQPLMYKVKKEQPASKKQKEVLRYLMKYHKIDLPVQIDYLSRNEISRITDKLILTHGRIPK